MKKILYIILFLAIEANCQITQKLVTKDLIINLRGQSNCAGKAGGTGDVVTPSYFKPINSKVKIWSTLSQTFEVLNAGVNSNQPTTNSSIAGEYGVEIPLSYKLYNLLKSNIYIIKHGADGTVIASWGFPAQSYSSYNQIGASNLQKEYALDKLNNKTAKELCTIWIQGESDAVNVTDAGNYQVALTNFINADRAYNKNNIPFIMVMPSDAVAWWPERATVVTAMNNIAATLPNCYVINTNGLPLIDGRHYNSAGIENIAQQIYTILLTQL